MRQRRPFQAARHLDGDGFGVGERRGPGVERGGADADHLQSERVYEIGGRLHGNLLRARYRCSAITYRLNALTRLRVQV